MQVNLLARNGNKGTLPTANSWTCQQNNANSAYCVTIPTANVNNNNKNNTYAVVPVAELDRLTDLLFRAEGDCWKNKKRRMDAARYHYNLKAVFDLANSIAKGEYKPTTSICFVLNYPRYREVFAARYIDRVVHHLVAPFILAVTESVHFANGNISHGNRRNFSAQTGAEQIRQYMRECPNGYVATMDISGFFMNIDRQRAYDIFVMFCEKHKPAPYANWYTDLMLRLLNILILHDPASDCVRNSPISAWQRIAPNKTLFGNNGRGLPIGNFYSQLIANLVLAIWGMELLKLGCKITQFVDDMCIVAQDIKTISNARKASVDVLRSLGLELHTKKYYIQPVRHGVYFCGRVVYANRIYTNNRTIRACKNRIRKAAKNCTLTEAYGLQGSFNSYTGIMCHAKSMRIQRDLAQRVRETGLAQYVYFRESTGHVVMQIRDEYKPRNVRIKELDILTRQQKQYEYDYKTKCSTK